MRLMLYLVAMFEHETEIGGDIELHNKAMNEAEEVLDALGGDPEMAVEIVIDGEQIAFQASDELIDAIAETSTTA